MHIFKKKIIIVLIFSFLSTGLLFGGEIPSLTWNSRLKVGAEMDSNIGEDPENEVSDKALKVFSQFGAKGYLSDKTNINFDFKGGIRKYSGYSNEDRFVGNINTNISRNWLSGTVIGFSGFLFYDYYKRDFRNSISYLGEGYFRIPEKIIDICDICFSFQLFNTKYKDNAFFNIQEYRYNLTVKKHINPRISFAVFTRFGSRDYDRKAFERSLAENVLYKDEIQKDIFNEIGMNIQYFKWFLVQFFALHRNNNSNSYGLSYTENRLGFIMGKKIIKDYMLKVYCEIESKHYDDPGEFFVVIDINEDKEKDNRAIIELTRNISDHVGLELRGEYSRNESRIRKLYYSKFLVSSGLLYKF